MTSHSFRLIPAFILAVLVLLPQSSIRAQEEGATDYVPPTAIAVMRNKVQPTFQAPGMEFMPIEIMDAWARQNFGVQWTSMTDVKLIVGVPMPGGRPPFGGAGPG